MLDNNLKNTQKSEPQVDKKVIVTTQGTQTVVLATIRKIRRVQNECNE